LVVAGGFGERPGDAGLRGSFFIFSVSGRLYSSGSSSSLGFIGQQFQQNPELVICLR
jgi:hypothetical protein